MRWQSDSSLVPKKERKSYETRWSSIHGPVNDPRSSNMLQVLHIIMWSIEALHANKGAIKPKSKDSIMN